MTPSWTFPEATSLPTSTPEAAVTILGFICSAMPMRSSRPAKYTPLWPSFAQVMDFAERSMRLSASGVRMSGRRAPFLIPMPTPERAMAARAPASTLPCFARSSIPAAGSMARSKASPASIWRFRAAARPKPMTSLCPVSRSKAGASSCSASLTPFEARTLISAARTEAIVTRAANPATAATSVLIFMRSPCRLGYSSLSAGNSGGKLQGDRGKLAAGYRAERAFEVARGVAGGEDTDDRPGLPVLQRHGHVQDRLASPDADQAASRAADVAELRDGEARLQALAGRSLRADRGELPGGRDVGDELLLQIGAGVYVAVLRANALGLRIDYHLERTVSGQIPFDRAHLQDGGCGGTTRDEERKGQYGRNQPTILHSSSPKLFRTFAVQISIRSRPTMTWPPKCLRTPSIHMSSVMELSSGGTKCVRTSVFTPAAAASLPRSSVTMWLASRCSRSVAALGTFFRRVSRPARCMTSDTSTSAPLASAISSGE